MAGIYLHIPFCKQACHYCDFHFSTSLKTKDDVLKAILEEIAVQKNYLNEEPIRTIYFGGGTPSILSAEEINRIIDQIGQYHDLNGLQEVTIETNPDDLDERKIQGLKNTMIDRFSIGVQSFFNDDLQYLNRAHSKEEALTSIKKVQDAGFENITIDLIYGIRNSNLAKWEANIDQAIKLQVPHLSCYALTIEEKTVFGNWLRKGKINVVDDEAVNEQFILLMDKMESAGFEHYEISNFAKEGKRAVHNSNYWKGVNYLGIGPGAHSYNGVSRQFNFENNVKYYQTIEKKEKWFEKEGLTRENKINEYIMTSLRTIEGIELNHLNTVYHYDLITENNAIKYLINDGLISHLNGFIKLKQTGKLLTDSISEKLFI